MRAPQLYMRKEGDFMRMIRNEIFRKRTSRGQAPCRVLKTKYPFPWSGGGDVPKLKKKKFTLQAKLRTYLQLRFQESNRRVQMPVERVLVKRWTTYPSSQSRVFPCQNQMTLEALVIGMTGGVLRHHEPYHIALHRFSRPTKIGSIDR